MNLTKKINEGDIVGRKIYLKKGEHKKLIKMLSPLPTNVVYHENDDYFFIKRYENFSKFMIRQTSYKVPKSWNSKALWEKESHS